MKKILALVLFIFSLCLVAQAKILSLDSNTLLSGRIEAEEVNISAGVKVLVQDGTVFSAERITIEGDLIAMFGTQSDRSGATLVLEASEKILLKGIVRAGGGFPQPRV